MTTHQYSDLSELNYSKERRILNEQLCYKNNKRIKSTVEKLTTGDELTGYPIRFSCECSNAACESKIPLTSDVFDQVHSVEGRYFVWPGHEQLDIENVDAVYDSYKTVIKNHRSKKYVSR